MPIFLIKPQKKFGFLEESTKEIQIIDQAQLTGLSHHGGSEKATVFFHPHGTPYMLAPDTPAIAKSTLFLGSPKASFS
jgi:hypothetical protein